MSSHPVVSLLWLFFLFLLVCPGFFMLWHHPGVTPSITHWTTLSTLWIWWLGKASKIFCFLETDMVCAHILCPWKRKNSLSHITLPFGWTWTVWTMGWDSAITTHFWSSVGVITYTTPNFKIFLALFQEPKRYSGRPLIWKSVTTKFDPCSSCSMLLSLELSLKKHSLAINCGCNVNLISFVWQFRLLIIS